MATAELAKPDLLMSMSAEKPVLERRHLFDPFPLLCAAVSVLTGRVKTILHGGSLSLVLEDGSSRSGLRYIIPESDASLIIGLEEQPEPPKSQWMTIYDRDGNSTIDLIKSNVGFWSPQYAPFRRLLKKERFVRRRLGKTLSRFCWHGETRPKNARNVTSRCTKSRWTGKRDIIRLARCFGYDKDAARATTSNSWDAITEFAKCARRRTKSGRLRFQKETVMAALRKSRYPYQTILGVFDVVYLRRSPKQVAEERGIPCATLKVYAARTRQICKPKDTKPCVISGFVTNLP